MRWDDLFADLEGQGAAELRMIASGEIAERTRYEYGLLTIRDRLDATIGNRLELSLLGGHRVRGLVREQGTDWVLLRQEPMMLEAIVALDAVLTITGLAGAAAAAEGDEPGLALMLRHLLRGLCRDRAVVELRLVDGTIVSGTIDRAARDHLEMAIHPADEVRRLAAVKGTLAVAIRGIAVVSVLS